MGEEGCKMGENLAELTSCGGDKSALASSCPQSRMKQS